MLKKLKIAYNKVHSFLFGQENEHIHTRQERKQYYGRIHMESEAQARMIHQYPKEGKFRFPLIADENEKLTKYEKEPNQQVDQHISKRKNTTKQPIRQAVTNQPIIKKNVQQKEKLNLETAPKVAISERKKFQGVNFKARKIPSPIYAFGKPPEINQLSNLDSSDEVIEMNMVEQDHSQISIVDNSRNFKPEAVIEEETYIDKEEPGIVVVEELEEKTKTETETENDVTKTMVEAIEEDAEDGIDVFDTVEPIDEENELETDVVETVVEEVDEAHFINGVHIAENLVVSEELDFAYEGNEEIEERVGQTFNLHEEVAATTRQEEVVVFENDHKINEKAKQLEQFTPPLNTIKNEAKTVEEETSRKTVVPFNVLMLHKDRLAQKKNEVNTPQKKAYQFPTLQLLNIPPRQPDNSNQWLEAKREILELTLANFNVQAKVVGVTKGPSVTRFEIQPEPGVKVSKITGLTDDIKLSLAARDIRIEAPIPGKNAIGIEVPNDVSDPVVIREILRSGEFQNNPSKLTVAMGLDIEGKPIITDIQKMPHGLIAGATGSGKSVCINSILISIMFKATPDEVKLMLVDPKMVELAPYNDIPHLVTPVITDAKQATIALKWAVEEMERRYELFVQNGVRDIKRYNDVMKKDDDPIPAMPYIVIVIDELADLMMVSPQDVEEAICRIAQKARACGIHLLLATQRPSVDVITGLIKANIPTRIAFSVSSQADSRTIIDSGGAERLLGKGDMLLFENGASKPVRVQGNFVSDEEIDRVIALVKEQRKPNYLFDKETLVKTYEAASDQEDDLFEEACYYVLEQGGASSSSLQRRFRIGFNRAARLIDMMEARGIISEAMGSKPRNVLISEEELSDRM
ncbi:DNA translocase FtsK [Anaerobacillus isosaccharinicus]|uniref:DNA translocase FtsK n=1 Tax=Anaerobacillus isosaccharinicus TaxID=1532552 RepID=A0A1S2KTU6_9BACI|nr:DNA translocase FtsK [Anaerobacillus isosaccharinicus]MBA5588013.1 DNA translocase FtsK [Anaerobacillus isosaccharinicus]QOY33841.1 DNA translocase FtsK [Anaerobacillus isosaccharinicus]